MHTPWTALDQHYKKLGLQPKKMPERPLFKDIASDVVGCLDTCKATLAVIKGCMLVQEKGASDKNAACEAAEFLEKASGQGLPIALKKAVQELASKADRPRPKAKAKTSPASQALVQRSPSDVFVG